MRLVQFLKVFIIIIYYKYYFASIASTIDGIIIDPRILIDLKLIMKPLITLKL